MRALLTWLALGVALPASAARPNILHIHADASVKTFLVSALTTQVVLSSLLVRN